MGLKDEAEALWQEIMREKGRLGGLAWELDRVLHRLRLAKVGKSGIEHRIIEGPDVVLDELRELVDKTRKEWTNGNSSAS